MLNLDWGQGVRLAGGIFCGRQGGQKGWWVLQPIL